MTQKNSPPAASPEAASADLKLDQTVRLAAWISAALVVLLASALLMHQWFGPTLDHIGSLTPATSRHASPQAKRQSGLVRTTRHDHPGALQSRSDSRECRSQGTRPAGDKCQQAD